jgi:hypothetical protein
VAEVVVDKLGAKVAFTAYDVTKDVREYFSIKHDKCRKTVHALMNANTLANYEYNKINIPIKGTSAILYTPTRVGLEVFVASRNRINVPAHLIELMDVYADYPEQYFIAHFEGNVFLLPVTPENDEFEEFMVSKLPTTVKDNGTLQITIPAEYEATTVTLVPIAHNKCVGFQLLLDVDEDCECHCSDCEGCDDCDSTLF